MNDDFRGNDVLELLNSLALEPLRKNVRHLYEDAYEMRLIDPEKAIKLCQSALVVFEKPSQTALGDSIARRYARGRFCLLIASICLNKDNPEGLKEAEKYYLQGKDEFHSKQWSHLESLACLGLAITQRKLEKFKEASDACEDAQSYIDHESIPSKIDKTDLNEAIAKERLVIHEFLLSSALLNKPEERVLPVFKISAGERLLTDKGTTDLNLLGKEDYERYPEENPQAGVFDLATWPEARMADYVLEIDEKVSRTDKDIEKGSWLFIREENNPRKLKGKTVAVLVINEGKVYASQKIFSMAKDHYFLKARSREGDSFIIAHYEADNFLKLNDYYSKHRSVRQRLVYEVRISGAVIGSVENIFRPTKGIKRVFVWRIPRVSNIAAGLGPIADDRIMDYVNLRESEPKDADYFVVVVEGDSMIDDGIFPGKNALIRQQANVENGAIAAIVIEAPGIEPLEVLKRYYVVEERPGRQHWFLKSSNPSAQHLVVVPSHTDIERIRKIYAEGIKTNKIVLYENAELKIAGKYIKLVEKN